MSVKAKGTKSKRARGPHRVERRFEAQSANNPWLVRVLGAIGATSLGAGAYGYLYAESFKKAAEAARAASTAVPTEALRMEALPLYMIAFATLVIGATIWLGTSSEPALRVGSSGIALDRGETRRMLWWAIKKIAWDAQASALVIDGKDETGAEWSLKIPAKAHRDGVGWVLKEALDRVPKVVDIEDSVVDQLPGARPSAGEKIDLEPLQVVGKRDAISGDLISYEPDACVCTRCERVYLKRTVKKKCACGASLIEAEPRSLALEDAGAEASETA